MAEAEEVLQDLARRGYEYFERRRPQANAPRHALFDLALRLDLLLTAVFDRRFPIRVAQPPAPRSWARRMFRRDAARVASALPATDGTSIWLPANLPAVGSLDTAEAYRTLALLQSMRAVRGSAIAFEPHDSALVRDLYLLLEADAAAAELAAMLPGQEAAIAALRRGATGARPTREALPAPLREAEGIAREALASEAERPVTPAAALERARHLAARASSDAARRGVGKDLWTGELRVPSPPPSPLQSVVVTRESKEPPARSARLPRKPNVRAALPGEDDEQSPGITMVQTSKPEESAEDPIGLSRPVDRDEQTSADAFADSLGELPEARLVARPGTPKEYLLSDDPPAPAARAIVAASSGPVAVSYPEWDWRAQAYRIPGAQVRLQPAPSGDAEWVATTERQHAATLRSVEKRFAMLRATRVRLRRQEEGDDIDLDHWTDARADFRAGLPLDQALYQAWRTERRDLAVGLLADISGSTDGWVAGRRRVIDVEREALLIVCRALAVLRERFSVQAFSGEGAYNVELFAVKRFDEPMSPLVDRRIAGLEPGNQTRLGAALRHATTLLRKETARHRLLVLVSDGKPNDVDAYEGRYGIEDTRMAVIEARGSGVFPFCLTVDRQAAKYLPHLFGRGQYALLAHPERLADVLLDWIRRLIVG
jgi:nitric oxide reductase NorD protein